MRKWRDESGQVLVMVALSMTVLLGFVAFATDVGLMLRQRRTAQTAADSAAMAAATESLNEGTPITVTSGMWTAASHDAALNGFTPGASNGTQNPSNGVTLTLKITPSIDMLGYNSPGYVQAVISMNTGTAFMNVFGIHSMNVSAAAIASNTIMSDGCIYVQNPPATGGTTGMADPAVDMSGNSLIAAVDCGMTINGDLNMGGSGSISAKFVAMSGTYTANKPGSNWSVNNPPQTDPMLKLQDPDNQPTVNTTTKTCIAPVGSGMSCLYNYQNGILSGTLPPDTVYVFDQTTNGGKGPSITGSVTGSNVTLYFMDNIPFDFDNNGAVTLTPPGYGGSCIGSLNPLCGVLIDAPTDGSDNNGTYSCATGKGNNGQNPGELYFNFGSTTTIVEGIVYAPYMQLFGQDQGGTTTFAVDLVVGNICMQSSPFLVQGYSGAQSPLTRVGLVY